MYTASEKTKGAETPKDDDLVLVPLDDSLSIVHEETIDMEALLAVKKNDLLPRDTDEEPPDEDPADHLVLVVRELLLIRVRSM